MGRNIDVPWWAIAAGIIESLAYGVRVVGIDGKIKQAYQRRLMSKLPASPYALYRIIRDPPGRYITEYGYLLTMPEVPTPTMVEYAIEEHVTPINQRAVYTVAELKRMRPGDPGVRTHWDLRWRDPETKEIHAVSIPKSRLPEYVDGRPERFAVIKVDDRHGHDLLINTGTKFGNKVLIETGYGRGHSRVIQTGRTFIWSGQHIDGVPSFHIWIPGKGGYAIILPKEWRNGTPRTYMMFPLKQEEVPHYDRPFRVRDVSSRPAHFEALMQSDEWVAEKKYDGAFYTIIPKGRPGHDYATVSVISRRSKHVDGVATGVGIDKAYNLVHIKFANWPKWAYNKKIYVEVHATKYRPPYVSEHGQSTGLLNSDPATSYEYQRKHGYLQVTILGVGDGDYADQQVMAAQLAQEVTFEGKPVFSLPESAITPTSKQRLVNRTQTKNGEGVVFKNLHGPTEVVKYTFKGETVDMRIVDTVPMQIKSSRTLEKFGDNPPAQNFVVEHPETGKLSTVGIRDPEGPPGSSEKLKIDVGNNPGKYLGGYVQVQARRANRPQAGDIQRIRLDKD